METARTPRSVETRAKETRPPATFVPTSLIPQLESADPDYVFRWIRVETRDGKPDNKNLSARLREGWVPVKADEVPEISALPLLATSDRRFDGMVKHAELLLCKISKEKAEARRKYYRDLAGRQIVSVDNDFFKENDRRMPLFRESNSIVGSKNS
jgi:hypothetical protein